MSLDSSSPVLLLVTSVWCREQGSHYSLPERFLSGLLAYCRLWPGSIIVATHVSSASDTELDHSPVNLQDLPFELVSRRQVEEDMDSLICQADLVVLAEDLLSIDVAVRCKKLRVPYAFIHICSFKTRLKMILLEDISWFRRAYRYTREYYREMRFREAVRGASGIQCNGVPSYECYGSLNQNVLLFFDQRIAEKNMATHEQIVKKFEASKSECLRIVYSGRFVKIKGVLEIPQIVHELLAHNINFKLDLFGDGPLLNAVKSDIEERQLEKFVEFHGNSDFDSEIFPFLKETAHISLCPHLQGDPAWTYLEALSAGVPILGYENEALSGLLELVEAGATVTSLRADSLAVKIVDFFQDLDTAREMSLNALAFAHQHPTDKTMDYRVSHYLSCLEGGR